MLKQMPYTRVYGIIGRNNLQNSKLPDIFPCKIYPLSPPKITSIFPNSGRAGLFEAQLKFEPLVLRISDVNHGGFR